MLDDVAARFTQSRIDFLQFVLAFDLDAEVVEARLSAAGRDGEIDARIIEHPFGVVRLHHGGRRGEQRRIESDRIRDVFD